MHFFSSKPHTQRASQDTFATELQVEREKNTVLQEELEGIRALDCDMEVRNWTLSEHADPLRRKLQQEVQQGTHHQEDQEKLLVANKHSLEVRANRESFFSQVSDQRPSAKLLNKGEVFCLGKKNSCHQGSVNIPVSNLCVCVCVCTCRQAHTHILAGLCNIGLCNINPAHVCYWTGQMMWKSMF